MEINQIKADKLLSKTQIDLADFVINPYRGCSFGCRYCYSQKNKSIRKKNKPWGSFLDVKSNALEVLQRELTSLRPKKVMLGSTTECFLPQEKEFKMTQSILKILKEQNIPIVILTKSSLIEDYISLINFNPQNKIYFTLMFSDDRLKALFEYNSPNFSQRIKTIQKLTQAGIKVKIHIGPYIPYLQDLKELFSRIPEKIDEVEVEVYNSRMGNFQEVLKIIKEKVSEPKAKDIEEVYSEARKYNDFCNTLEKETHQLNKDYDFKLNFIIPEFDSWYTDRIRYEL